MHFKTLLLTFLLTACGDAPLEFEGQPCAHAPQSGEGVSYDADHMGCVDITMEPEDFEALADQYRFEGDVDDQWPEIISATARSCSEPYPSEYSYFSADIETDGWQASDVGIRKKGFIGSTVGAGLRPSLKVKTDEFIDGQQMGDTDRATFNNNHQDPSRTRTCLAYSVFADAGHPAPLCNLANVSMNGEPLGAYSHVESIKKRFLRRTFGNDDGSLYEGTLADFTDAHLAGLPSNLGRFESKTSDTDPTGLRLQMVADALQAPNDELEGALAEVLDLDAFMLFWALETVTNHNDGYAANTNNFYIYFDPDNGGRGVFIPWGTDQTMYDWRRSMVTSELTRRISRVPELRERYLDTVQWVLDEVWDEAVLHERIDAFEAQVLTAEKGPSYRKESAKALRDWVDGRRADIEDFVADGGEIGQAGQGPCTGDTDPRDFLLAAEVATVAGATCSSARLEPSTGLLLLLLLAIRRSPRSRARA